MKAGMFLINYGKSCLSVSISMYCTLLPGKKRLVLSFHASVCKLDSIFFNKNHRGTAERYAEITFGSKHTCFSKASENCFWNCKTLHSSPHSKEWFIHILWTGLFCLFFSLTDCVLLDRNHLYVSHWKLVAENLSKLEKTRIVEGFPFFFFFSSCLI